MSSLFIETHPEGLAFYINGDLQFDTVDEAIYHEFLAIPALLLAIRRFPEQQLRVLICGGGDGLVAREILKFSQVKHIDLVDYDPEVVKLGKTVFAPYNQDSLSHPKVTIYLEDAFTFLDRVPSNSYHLIINDFTYPRQQEDTKVYSKQWYQKLNLGLQYGGILSTNAMSPQQMTTGFWCVYNTLLAANLNAKPLQIKIPSFSEHGYGTWGFFIASQIPIKKPEIINLDLPHNLAYLTPKKLLSSFIFPNYLAQIRHQISINTLRHYQLAYYLLNCPIINQNQTLETVNFLEINESGDNLKEAKNHLSLEATTQAWIEKITTSLKGQNTVPDLQKIFPLQHYYHNQEVRTEWLAIAENSLRQIDLDKLYHSLFSKIKEIPPHLAEELKLLKVKISSGQPLGEISPTVIQFFTALIVTLLMANIVTPDSVFAKGYYGGSSYHRSTGYSNYTSTPFVWGMQQNFGAGMMGIGLILLLFLHLSNNNNE